MLKQARLIYCSDKITSCQENSKTLFKVTKHLLECPDAVVVPSNIPSKELAK